MKDLHSEEAYVPYNIILPTAVEEGNKSIDFGVFNDLAGSGKTGGFIPLAQEGGARQCQMGFDSMGRNSSGLISPAGEMPNFQAGVSFERKEENLSDLLEKPWDNM